MRTLFSLLISLFLAWAAPSLAVEKSDLPGNYELQGVMEMAGMLMLEADQKYTAGFSYGAADWVEQGTWKLEAGEVVLSGGKFKLKNYDKLPLFLPTGSRLKYQDGKLTLVDPQRKVAFLDPNKSSSSEGKMRVKGKVMKLDAQSLVVDVKGECMTFDLRGLSEAALQQAKQKQGKTLDVEIPFSAIVSSGGC